MAENIITLFMLLMLQIVLGFDNLLYISLESKNAPKEKQAYVRKVGILMAIVLRIGLLFFLISVIDYFQKPWFELPFEGVATGSFNLHSLIVLAGGVFIIYTAMKEIWHMVGVPHVEQQVEGAKKKSVAKVIAAIIVMNLVFSFDSILSAMALTDVFWVMATAIVMGGLLMIWLADRVAQFLERNRMYEVLGLFILFIVGIMLLTEGGRIAHLTLFDNPITPMSKTTFYFVIVVLVVVDIVQSRYQKKLIAIKESEARKREEEA